MRNIGQSAGGAPGRGRTRAGFSLIEMVIAVSVLAVLASIFIPYSRRGEGQLVLAREQSFIHAALVKAKNFSIQKFDVWGNQVCGWGVHLEPQLMGADEGLYIVFRDTPGPGGCGASNKIYDQGEEVEAFAVDPRLRIALVQPGVSDVLFVPPEQFVFIDGCSPSPPRPEHAPQGCLHAVPPSEVTVTLETKDGAFSAGVRFNKVGQISFVQ